VHAVPVMEPLRNIEIRDTWCGLPFNFSASFLFLSSRLPVANSTPKDPLSYLETPDEPPLVSSSVFSQGAGPLPTPPVILRFSPFFSLTVSSDISPMDSF